MPYLVKDEELTLDSDLIKKIDAWAKKQPLVLSRSQAVNMLIRKGLGDEKQDPTLIRLSSGEKIIISLLTRRWQQEFPQSSEAFEEGQLYALSQGALSPASLNDYLLVVNVLSMWAHMKKLFQLLDETQRQQVAVTTGWNEIEFPGFATFYDIEEDKYYRTMKFVLKYDPLGTGYMEDLSRELRLEPQDENFEQECMDKYAATWEQMPAYQAMLTQYSESSFDEVLEEGGEPDPQMLIDLLELYRQYTQDN